MLLYVTVLEHGLKADASKLHKKLLTPIASIRVRVNVTVFDPVLTEAIRVSGGIVSCTVTVNDAEIETLKQCYLLGTWSLTVVGNSQMCIVTGPNQELAIKLIKRMKAIFEEKLGITFDSKETVLELNGCIIEAFPSNHLDAFRSLTNPKFILLDEADFFRKSEQEDVKHVSERYIAKSDPFIVKMRRNVWQ